MNIQLRQSASPHQEQPVVNLHEIIAHERDFIQQALQTFTCRIPLQLEPTYLAYQQQKSYRFLFLINALALLTYFISTFADFLVLGDVSHTQIILRLISALCFFIIFLCYFKWIKSITYLELHLPIHLCIIIFIWFTLLNYSHSPDTHTYKYASSIFIILANIGIQVRFISSLLPSFLIICLTCLGIYFVSDFSLHEVFIFSIAYFPVVCFSLFISWNTTLKNRQIFLNYLLDEYNRHILDEIAHTDSLTGLHNRRYFEQLANQHIAESRDANLPLHLLLIDIDHFKKINDTYGHDIGDAVLEHIAQVTKQNLREMDILARFGGEEFIVLLPNTDLKQSDKIANRICDVLSQSPFILNDQIQFNITCSVGYARFLAYRHDLRSLIKCADLALYTAKQQGRNRVVMHHYPT